MNDNNFGFADAKSCQSQSQVGSFKETLQSVHHQIDSDFFCERDKPLVEGICLNIADIYLLPPKSEVQIGGAKIPAWQVKEIYKLLTHDHVDTVIKKYQQIAYRITHVKTYLRTALYNSVFELEAGIENAIHVDLSMPK